ncbi:hypothetical protein CsSME_00043480 [Camellia sinensis var. sinensis]
MTQNFSLRSSGGVYARADFWGSQQFCRRPEILGVVNLRSSGEVDARADCFIGLCALERLKRRSSVRSTQPGDQPSLVAFVTQLSNPEYLSP